MQCRPPAGRGPESLLIRESLHHDRLKDLDLDMIEHLHDCFEAFPPQPIRTDDRRIPHLGFEHVCKVRGIHDLGVRAERARSVWRSRPWPHPRAQGQVPDIRMGQVERFDRDTAGNQGIGEVFHHLLRAAVHGHVRDHHFVLHRIGDPVRIGIEDQLRVFVDRAMARGDQVDFQGGSSQDAL